MREKYSFCGGSDIWGECLADEDGDGGLGFVAGEPAGDAVSVVADEDDAALQDVVLVVLGIVEADDLVDVAVDAGVGIGGEVGGFGIADLEGAAEGGGLLGKQPGLAPAHVAKGDSYGLHVPEEFFGVFHDFHVAAWGLDPAVVVEVLGGAGRDGQDSLAVERVEGLVGVVVAVAGAIAVDTEALGAVDVDGLVGLVLDLDEEDAVFLVVVDGVLDAFLDDGDLYVGG